MNRIVIIGNGFDKAHSLPTGYSDFLEYLKKSIAYFNKTKTNISYTANINGIPCKQSRNYIHRKTIEGDEDKWLGVYRNSQRLEYQFKINPHGESIYFASLFEESERLGYWSDLESHYFQTLCRYKSSAEHVALINTEFAHLKELLYQYLKTEIDANTGFEKKYDMDKANPIYEMLKLQHNEYQFEKNYFITFNYTSKILNQYLMWLKDGREEQFPLSPIHIHGDLHNPENPIIFGYGDENSPEYKELELLQNNELLTNFKTFQYLRSNKYNEVLGLLEDSDENYIQIIGHSSGLCDKALLRTIFQHQNVRYIESTYYKNETKYFENLFNISRIFDDNTLMREKIVPLSDTFMI